MQPNRTPRALGTMVAYGFPRGDLGVDLSIAERLGATCLEALPDWASLPDPAEFARRVADRGFVVHSAHGCWGGQSIAAQRVDLGEPEESRRTASVDDLRRCVDWLSAAGGRYLIVHPGGLSEPEQRDARRDALIRSLAQLSDHAAPADIRICVENMPPGVHPGSRMADLAELVAALDRPGIRLALDTGHAHISTTTVEETEAAGDRLATTHVHDNNGRQDTHEAPGYGSIDWDDWSRALDRIGYSGPVMLECIRRLRQSPELIDDALLCRLRGLTHGV